MMSIILNCNKLQFNQLTLFCMSSQQCYLQSSLKGKWCVACLLFTHLRQISHNLCVRRLWLSKDSLLIKYCISIGLDLHTNGRFTQNRNVCLVSCNCDLLLYTATILYFVHVCIYLLFYLHHIWSFCSIA